LCEIKPVAGKHRVSIPTSIPNFITLGRILLVPIIIWAIASDQMELAFAVFVGLSLGALWLLVALVKFMWEHS